MDFRLLLARFKSIYELDNNLESLTQRIQSLFGKSIDFELPLDLDLFTIDRHLTDLWNIIHEQSQSPPKDSFRDAYSLVSIFLAQFVISNGYHLEPFVDQAMCDMSMRQLDISLLLGTSNFAMDVKQCVQHLEIPFTKARPKPAVLFDVTTPNLPHGPFRNEIPRIPSINLAKFLSLEAPVILQNCISHWPCICDPSRNWRDFSYLSSVMGHRTFPIEIGRKYTDSGWTQQLLSFDEYVQRFLPLENLPHPNYDQVGYLAQVDMFTKVERLARDFSVPDLVSARCGSSSPIVNAWIGPAGTITPCHFDPYSNLLCQVFGRKFIRVFPPDSVGLYPHSTSSLMSNTSQVDVEDPDYSLFPEHSLARPIDCVLEAGEVLYLPEGWWHYVRSLTTSFSVNFWW